MALLVYPALAIDTRTPVRAWRAQRVKWRRELITFLDALKRGRGSDLLTCGDIEANPGPSNDPGPEDYALTHALVQEVLTVLAHGEQPARDCFASARNARFAAYWDKGDDAFSKPWGGGELLWMNPPFSMISRVLDKISAENANVVLIAPQWTHAPRPPRLVGPLWF